MIIIVRSGLFVKLWHIKGTPPTFGSETVVMMISATTGLYNLFEKHKKYCYTASCNGKNCLSNLLSRIDRDNLGTFCNANGLNCWWQERTEENIDGTLVYKFMTGCDVEEHKCFPSTILTKEYSINRKCCDGHLFNGVDFKANDVIVPGQSYCYEYSCFSDDHDSCQPERLQTAIDESRTSLCPLTDEGCYLISYYNNNKANYGFITGCFTEGFQNETKCSPKISKDTNFTSVWHCCDTDRCITREREKTQVNQCYSVSCVGEGCLEASVKSGNYMVCNKSKFGCEARLTKTNIDSIYTLACSTSPCEPGTETVGNFTVIGCCQGDRCLPDNLTSGVATCLKLLRIPFLFLFALNILVSVEYAIR